MSLGTAPRTLLPPDWHTMVPRDENGKSLLSPEIDLLVSKARGSMEAWEAHYFQAKDEMKADMVATTSEVLKELGQAMDELLMLASFTNTTDVERLPREYQNADFSNLAECYTRSAELFKQFRTNLDEGSKELLKMQWQDADKIIEIYERAAMKRRDDIVQLNVRSKELPLEVSTAADNADVSYRNRKELWVRACNYRAQSEETWTEIKAAWSGDLEHREKQQIALDKHVKEYDQNWSDYSAQYLRLKKELQGSQGAISTATRDVAAMHDLSVVVWSFRSCIDVVRAASSRVWKSAQWYQCILEDAAKQALDVDKRFKAGEKIADIPGYGADILELCRVTYRHHNMEDRVDAIVEHVENVPGSFDKRQLSPLEVTRKDQINTCKKQGWELNLTTTFKLKLVEPTTPAA